MWASHLVGSAGGIVIKISNVVKQFMYHISDSVNACAPYKMLGVLMGIWYIFSQSASFPADLFFIIGSMMRSLDKKRQQGIKKINIQMAKRYIAEEGR